MPVKPALVALLVALAASPALAQPSLGDANGDGKLGLAEFQAFQRQRMLANDTDKDGKLAKAEMKAAAKAQGRSGLQLDIFWGMIDGDHDGFLTGAEVDKLSARSFARLDKDHDGSLDAAEIAAARQQRRAAR